MATISGSRNAPAGDVAKMDYGASHPYTCNTCQVAFRNSDLQKGHMRSDWHRYNLKRRVASLPPISSEVFTEKVLQARAVTTAEEDKAGFNKACDTCQKTYYSENSYRNHISSAKHKAKVAAAARKPAGKAEDEASSVMSSTLSLGDPAEVDSDANEEFNEVVESLKKTGINEQVSPVRRPSSPHLSAAGQHKNEHPVSLPSSEEPSTSTTPTATPVAKVDAPVPTLQTCLFCNYNAPTPALNVAHMERIHGMFIPEKNYLVDLEGLLTALQERVFELNECLNCGKVKGSTFAVQTHMRDKSHCQIPYTTEEEQLEIGEFYDFRSTYSDADEWESEDEEMDDAKEPSKSNGAKLGAKRSVKVDGDGANEDGEEDGWETDSSASSLDSDDLHAVPAEKHYHQYERLNKHPHHSRDDQRAHHQRDGWHAHNHKRAHAVFYDDYELHLPSGRSVGHRSLNRYFRQNLHSHPSPEERAERLALEAAEAENAMDVDGEEARGRRADGTHGRALISRETRGLGAIGAADPNSSEVSRVVRKGRKEEFKGLKGKDLEVSRMYFKEKHRNHASHLR